MDYPHSVDTGIFKGKSCSYEYSSIAAGCSRIFVTFMDMGVVAHSYAPIASYFCFAAGIGSIWVSSAGILNAAFGKTVIPMPGPILK